ncbi:MAG: hypothetical protein U0R64_02830 [Candidatus Nanopelagicales bacterium]
MRHIMAKRKNTARALAALAGVGAVVAASVLPGTLATAEETGDVQSTVTRAVLIQGNANGEIGRTTLVTQVNLDGNGQAQFTVPVAEGSTPKNMDSFGSPEVVDGQAQYDIAVDGPQTFRTSQDYNPDEIPVTVEVAAELDGQPISPSDLAGQSGLAKLTYTFTNNSGEPTQLSYEDALGNTITEERDIPVPMAAATTITFGESWQEITSPKASAVSGDGTGSTLVSATSAMLPDSLPGQDVSQTLEIEGRVTNAVVPPVDIKVAVLNPSKSPDLQEGIQTGEDGADLAAKLTDAGTQLYDGAGQLADGLKTAVDGANQIADGVSSTLAPGITALYVEGIGTLRSKAASLPETVRSSPDFSQITDGFEAIRSAMEGVKEGAGVYKDKSSQKPGPWIKKNGDVDSGRADVARTLWALVYGARTRDIPTDAKNPNDIPNTNNGGLTNPACSLDDPESHTNPCGAWQVANAIKGGVSEIGAALSDPKSGGGAWVFKALATSLGCKTTQPSGYTGPVVAPVTGIVGNPCDKPIEVGGSGNCPNPLFDPSKPPVIPNLPELPCNLVLNALLGGIDAFGQKQAGLTQSLYKPLDLKNLENSGAVSLLSVYFPVAISKLLGNITTDPNGYPDRYATNTLPDGSDVTTATGIVMQTRANLAFGGIGSDGYPAHRCEGYKRTGDPSSGPNENADPDRVKETCAAGDVLQIAIDATDLLEEGVSYTLLDGISEELLAGVGDYSPGCEPTATLACAVGTIQAGVVDSLEPGTRQLADGLPAAVDGAEQIQNEGGKALQDQGNEGSQEAGLALATFEALQTRVDSGAGIPGGAPQGVDDINGVYAFAFDGAGGTATENAARAGLGFLALIAAGGVGAILANRASGG